MKKRDYSSQTKWDGTDQSFHKSNEHQSNLGYCKYEQRFLQNQHAFTTYFNQEPSNLFPQLNHRNRNPRILNKSRVSDKINSPILQQRLKNLSDYEKTLTLQKQKKKNQITKSRKGSKSLCLPVDIRDVIPRSFLLISPLLLIRPPFRVPTVGFLFRRRRPTIVAVGFRRFDGQDLLVIVFQGFCIEHFGILIQNFVVENGFQDALVVSFHFLGERIEEKCEVEERFYRQRSLVRCGSGRWWIQTRFLNFTQGEEGLLTMAAVENASIIIMKDHSFIILKFNDL